MQIYARDWGDDSVAQAGGPEFRFCSTHIETWMRLSVLIISVLVETWILGSPWLAVIAKRANPGSVRDFT